MEHICNSEECNQLLRYGVKVVQMLMGNSYMGYITPAWSRVLAEWHEGCFREFALHAQRPPYRCQLCQARIAHGDAVLCFVIGDETSTAYSVCERRGYEIYSVRHVNCQVEKEGQRSFTRIAQGFGCGLKRTANHLKLPA